MKIRKRLLLVGVVAVLLLTVAVLSESGRLALTRVFSTRLDQLFHPNIAPS